MSIPLSDVSPRPLTALKVNVLQVEGVGTVLIVHQQIHELIYTRSFQALLIFAQTKDLLHPPGRELSRQIEE